jgi:lactam utilization protein B
MKLEKMAVPLDEQELLELETIVQDGDKEAAIQFLRRLRQRIQQVQAKSVRP